MKKHSLLLLLLLAASCVNDIEEPTDNTTHRVTLATRTTEGEAGYKHALLLFKGNGTGANTAAIEAQQAEGAAAVTPFALVAGGYTVAAVAYSNSSNIVWAPAPTKGSTLSTYLTVGSGETPDILFATTSFTVAQEAATVPVPLDRIVGRAIVTLNGVPTTPSVQSIALSVSKLTDRVALNRTYSVSGGSALGISRTIALSHKEGNIYTNGADGTILMPSMSGVTVLPLTLTITYADNSISTKTFEVTGSIRAGYSSAIALNLQFGVPQAFAFSYAPWKEDSYEADVEMGEPTTPDPEPELGDIGTLAHGGIVCAPNLVMHLEEKSHLWCTLVTKPLIGGGSADGAVNYAHFEAYADGIAARWAGHPAYEYIKTLRTSTAVSWYLPSAEEWSAIAANLGILNTELAAGGATLIGSGAGYWTSTENGADFAYFITPSTRETMSITKSNSYRVRVIKKIAP